MLRRRFGIESLTLSMTDGFIWPMVGSNCWGNVSTCEGDGSRLERRRLRASNFNGNFIVRIFILLGNHCFGRGKSACPSASVLFLFRWLHRAHCIGWLSSVNGLQHCHCFSAIPLAKSVQVNFQFDLISDANKLLNKITILSPLSVSSTSLLLLLDVLETEQEEADDEQLFRAARPASPWILLAITDSTKSPWLLRCCCLLPVDVTDVCDHLTKS